MPNIPYQSTPEDRRRAVLLGVSYVVLAIGLAVMLFKIWPPTPWPSDQALQNPELAKAFADCECPVSSPTPTPTPTPTPQAAASAGTATPGASRPSTGAPATPTATPTVTPTAISATATAPTPLATPVGTSPAATAPARPETQQPKGEGFFISVPIKFLGWCFRTSFDERLILLVIIAGILGSFVHGATSLADYIGNDNFNRSWTWFYLLRPAIGMSLALVFYFVIRGGFLTTSGGAKDINPYGIAALAGLVGMFSKQATDKLSEVFGTLFRAAAGEGDEKRSGSLGAKEAATTVTRVDPTGGPVAGGNRITITGTGFAAGAKVFVGGKEATNIEVVNDTTIKADAAAGGSGVVDVDVVNEAGQKSTKAKAYTYTEGDGGNGGDGDGDGENDGGDDGAAHDTELKADTPDEDLPITKGGVE